jgi:hypothetical protein
LLQTALAGAIYAGFSLYLYQPYFGNFGRWQYLLVLNAFVASLGCFLLSRRWVSGFPGSFFAGAVYGFGPFMLGLSKFHPTAGFLAAIIPWLFCPAAFVGRTRWRWVGLSLLVLPFLAILTFFKTSAHFRLFAMPVQISLHPEDVGGLLAPLVAVTRHLLAPLVAVTRQLTPLGFYHVPIAALIMGFSMLLAARRFGILVIIAIGTALAFCKSFLGVSPIIWLTLPLVCGSVMIGAGTQALLSAGGWSCGPGGAFRSDAAAGNEMLSNICRAGRQSGGAFRLDRLHVYSRHGRVSHHLHDCPGQGTAAMASPDTAQFSNGSGHILRRTIYCRYHFVETKVNFLWGIL